MILSILDIKKQGKKYIIATLICILFTMIYELFSHDVYSNFMIFSFMIPLIFGVIVYYGVYLSKLSNLPSKLEISMYNAGIATLTLGSIMQGVLEIYGTTNSHIYIYLIVGILLISVSVIKYFFKNKK